MFNDELWPDFTKLPSEQAPTMRFEEIEVEKPFTIGELTFTPIEVEHLIPTVGFLVEEGSDTAIVYTSDTGPTDRVWQVASSQPNLKAVITEISFSGDVGALASASGHMTPDILAAELKKLTRQARVLITHTKPGHVSRIEAELKQLNLPGVELIEQNKIYTF
jgi:cAMP phosphodiesterase